MELTKEQTIQILYNKNKRQAISKKYKTSTKFKWKCLSCMKDIYIRYDSCSRLSIFCSECYPRMHTQPNIVQYQYLRKLKEQQLEYVVTYANTFIDG